jgi:hypothetical protein
MTIAKTPNINACFRLLKIAAVKIRSYYQLPEGLAVASVSPSFTLEGIIQALTNATNYY